MEEEKNVFVPVYGLSVREWLAGQAMSAMLSDKPMLNSRWVAEHAVKVADALIEELNTTEEEE